MKHRTSAFRSAFFSSVVFAALLSGCEKEPQTLDWYKAHEAERMERIRECKAYADKIGKTQDCVNAKQAQREILNSGKREQ
ncbi:MAG: EexN family lipoprotein [Azoarcus sp.]|jgi:ABC-type uncharacterized transport system auxiliary subunit|nr:EexN family lipoprotein [Azoarcus sp.]